MGKKKLNKKQITAYSISILIILLVHLPPPAGLSEVGFKMLGIAIISAVLWSTDAVDIPVTAAIIIFLEIAFGVMPLNKGLSYLAHPVNALLFVGFALAAGLKKYDLDKRISLKIINYAGTNVKKLLLFIMMGVAFLSMWMSNTSTIAIMVPIIAGILSMSSGENKNIGKSFMIGIAYAGTIGGMATPVGTTPNPITIAFLNDMANIEITFLEWVAIGLPFVLFLIPIAWLLLLILFPPEVKDVRISNLEIMSEDFSEDFSGMKRMGMFFAVLITLWIGGSFFPVPDGWLYLVSLAGSVFLFIPGIGVLEWKDTKNTVDWGVLILIGGGLALGGGLTSSGVIDWIVAYVVGNLSALPVYLVVIIIAMITSISILFFCSITATSTAFVPIAITLALQLNINPVILAAAAGIASSFAFLLPANTPPNAIAYSSGYFETKDMILAGTILLFLSILVFVVISKMFWPIIF